MARIRTIKPEFWTSEQVAECSPMARLLFIGMWNFCDDAGVHPDSAMRLKMEVFPADPIDAQEVENLLGELIDAGLIRRFSAQGKSYIAVTGWHHQKIDNPSFRYPSPNPMGTLSEPYPNPTPRNRKGREEYIRSTVEGDHARGFSEADIAAALPRLAKVYAAAGTPRKSQDASLAQKAALLSTRAPYSERWLNDALQGLTLSNGRKRTPYAYLTDCLKEGALKLGRNLMADLKAVSVPDELNMPPPPPEPRMCAVVDE